MRQHPFDVFGKRKNPEEQAVQIFVTSHLMQFRVEEQSTHPTPVVRLHVDPFEQHPYEVLGSKYKPVLHKLH